MSQVVRVHDSAGRRSFIGGSDARIIMGNDEAALERLWREKRGEAEPPDYSDNLNQNRSSPGSAGEAAKV
jgi:predicted phage-related endonuclease